MFTRRNWLLRCSILINIAVVLYICSHVMIGGGNNFATGPAYFIQEDVPKIRQMTTLVDKKDESRVKEQDDPFQQDIQISLKDDEPQKFELRPQPQLELKRSESDNSMIVNDDSAGATQTQQEHDVEPQPKELPEVPHEEKRFEIPTDSNYVPPEKVPNEPSGQQTSQSQQQSQSQSQPQSQPQSQSQSQSQPQLQQQEPVTFVNNTNTDGYVPTGDEKDFEDRLKSILKCHDRNYVPETLQRGDFWVLKNYVRADHGELKCHDTITYTTHADYTFLDNLIPLLERWNAPISIALHGPGADFAPTINSIKYLRDCLPESSLVRHFVTFHIYFSTKHIPKNVPKYDKVLEPAANCTVPPPFVNVSSGQLYKTQKKLLYPVNVGRNIARDAALTHFILASDIELYPNPGLVKKFLEMITRNDVNLQRKNPRVFPLSIFEVESSAPVPKDKTELQDLLKVGKAIPFHKRVCSSCHGVPKSKEWMAANETEELGVFHIGKRVGYFVHWEPIYIGTHADPHYDERLSWEGKSDKMTQGYALCALDYEFHILDNAFLVHKPGIKVLKKDPRRAMLAAKTNQLIKKIIYPELRIMYGTRKGCAV